MNSTGAWVKAKTGTEAEDRWFLPLASMPHHAEHVSGFPDPLWSRKGPCAIREDGRSEHGHPDTGGTWLLSKPVFASEAESSETDPCTAVPPAHHRPLGVQGQGMPSAPACLPGVPDTANSISPVTSSATLSPPLRGNTFPPECSSLSPTDPRPQCHCSSCDLQHFHYSNSWILNMPTPSCCLLPSSSTSISPDCSLL